MLKAIINSPQDQPLAYCVTWVLSITIPVKLNVVYVLLVPSLTSLVFLVASHVLSVHTRTYPLSPLVSNVDQVCSSQLQVSRPVSHVLLAQSATPRERLDALSV